MMTPESYVRSMLAVVVSWLPLAAAITGLSLLIYASVQQNYRQGLNDPQIQLAEDTANLLESGASPKLLFSDRAVDIMHDLSPWIAVYDATGTPVSSSGVLDGAQPQPPRGVFEALKQNLATGAGIKTGMKTAEIERTGQNRLTWQPQADVRQAIVVDQVEEGPYAGYFVLAGRNMREVESREARLAGNVFFAWVALMALTLFLKILAVHFGRRLEA